MSFNNSKASSFDPFDYYKKLTQCLAKRNNNKVDFRNIPGVQQRNNNRKMKPLITKQHLQAKFLAKYNNTKKQQQTSQGQKNPSQAKSNVSQKKSPLNFNVKASNLGQPKRKREPECYINLPTSFFQSFEGPDMSIFKKPEVPPLKKTKAPEPPASIGPSCNMTINTITSATFKPKTASTPLEKPQPMISDPDDILSSLGRSKGREKIEEPAAPPKIDLAARAKKFMDLVDQTANKIDIMCFANEPDPIQEIRSRVMEIYETSSQRPRLINETLMSSCVNQQESPEIKKSSSPLQHSSLPVPEFFEKKEKIKKKKQSSTQMDLNRTSDIFNWSTKLGAFNKYRDAPAADLDDIFSPKFAFNKSPGFLLDGDSPFALRHEVASPVSLTPLSVFPTRESNNYPFDFSPLEGFTLDWETSEAPDVSNTFAVFRSPPPRNSQSRSRASQRSQKESSLHENFEVHADSSLSTYKWTPNVDFFNNSIQSSISPTFARRNMFKDSYEFI